MKKILKKVIIYAFCKIPIKKNKIFLCNFYGKGYGGNPKFIVEEMKKKDYKCVYIWMVKNRKEEMPEEIKPVKAWTIRYYYHLATSKIIISNVRMYLGIPKRKNQIYLQTWHAPFSPKCVEGDAEDKLPPKYIEEAKYDGTICNAILVNSELQEKQFKRAFWLNKDVEYLRYGLPRNDFLINNKNNKDLALEIRKKLKLRAEDFVVLYAPTFRDDFSLDGYKIDFRNIEKAFAKKFAKNIRIIVRLHPNVQDQMNYLALSDNIIDGSIFPDMSEISLISDFLISDYSTSIFDFAILGKPAIICALDFYKYKFERGILKEFYEFPFPITYSNEELIDEIFKFNYENYNKKVEDYFKKNKIYDSGNASKMTANWILNKIVEK
mgnify:FL=1